LHQSEYNQAVEKDQQRARNVKRYSRSRDEENPQANFEINRATLRFLRVSMRRHFDPMINFPNARSHVFTQKAVFVVRFR
jgi:hypothetical protein